MQLVERHVIVANDSRFAAIDQAAFAAKNLYNAANYLMRQEYIFQGGRVLSFKQLYHHSKLLSVYTALPRKVSQHVLKTLHKNWKSFLAARASWITDPSKFYGQPGLPRYLDKQKGRFLLIYTTQALSRPAYSEGRIIPSGLNILVKTKQTAIDQVRIVPKRTHYVVEVIYERAPKPVAVDNNLIAGIDLGIDNLATIASNKTGFIPVIVNGRPLKSINQFYNKRRAALQAWLPAHQYQSHRLERLTENRNRRIEHRLHTASKRIIDLLIQEKIGTIVIGKNDGWKQKVNLGRRTNQIFVNLPHARFIHMLTYKAELCGIQVILTDESYTSKCSFVDQEAVGKHAVYAGMRVKRGLFRAANQRTVYNADVNGALNIIRKVFPMAFEQGIEGVVVHPVRLAA